MDDIQEYAQMRRDAESHQKRSAHQTTAMAATGAGSASKNTPKASQPVAVSSVASTAGPAAAAAASDTVAIVVDAVARQTRAEAIRERIGFDPTPRNS